MNKELFEVAEYALEALKAGGADGAVVSAQRGQSDELNVDAGAFSLMRTTFDSTLGIRALIGGRKGVAYTNRLDPEALDKAIASALDAARASEPDDAEAIAESIGEQSFTYGAREADLDKIYDRCQELLTGVKAEFPKIEIVKISARYASGVSFYANSNGTRARQKGTSYGVSLQFCARDGEKVSSFNGYGFSSENLDAPLLENAELRRQLAETERQIDTAPVQGKFVGKILASPDCAAGFLSSVLGNCAGDGALIMGTSPWKDKLGTLVADRRLNLTLNSLDPRVINGARLTGDGYLAEPQEIIRDGELVSFALSLYGSRKTGLPRAKNSGNMIIGAGEQSFDELLAGIGDGLLINRFSGGSPAQNGEFSGVAKNSFLIKDGKITDAVSETMVSGNLLDMLQNIAGISREVLADGGGAAPWIVFDGVTISGK